MVGEGRDVINQAVAVASSGRDNLEAELLMIFAILLLLNEIA